MKRVLLPAALLAGLMIREVPADPPRHGVYAEGAVEAAIAAIVNDPSLPDFARYPLSMAMIHLINEHAAGRIEFFDSKFPALPPRPGQTREEEPASGALLLAITIHLGGELNGGVTTRHAVSTGGMLCSWREVFNHAYQAAGTRQLPPSRVMRLIVALDNLPEVNVYPPLEDLAIVSFRDDDEWVTRTLPMAAVREILGLLSDDGQSAKQRDFSEVLRSLRREF